MWVCWRLITVVHDNLTTGSSSPISVNRLTVLTFQFQLEQTLAYSEGGLLLAMSCLLNDADGNGLMKGSGIRHKLTIATSNLE
jgi:hypothetical protein